MAESKTEETVNDNTKLTLQQLQERAEKQVDEMIINASANSDREKLKKDLVKTLKQSEDSVDWIFVRNALKYDGADDSNPDGVLGENELKLLNEEAKNVSEADAKYFDFDSNG